MTHRESVVYPYIPNSVPEAKREMLAEIGADGVDELYQDVPAALRLGRPLDLPEPLLSEAELKRHVSEILSRNATCEGFVLSLIHI